jgi:hypothetical protein
LNFTWNDNKYEFNALNPPNFQNNFDVKNAISCSGIYDFKNLKIALGSKWFSGKPFTLPKSTILNPGQTQIVYDFPNNDRISEYFQVNFSTSYHWNFSKKTNFQLSFSIINLLDKRNNIGRYYRINTNENRVERIDTYSMARTPNVSLKIDF